MARASGRRYLSPRVVYVTAACLHGLLLAAAATARAETPIDFNRDVRPVLAENCFKCHGPDAGAREADLRLDTRAGATRTLGDNRVAIAPGDPLKSELIERVSSADDEARMPPPATGKRLTLDEIETLRRWITAGGEYSRHWSLEPIREALPPTVNGSSSTRNPVDDFVLARLEAEGLALSPEARSATLVRRLYLDLIGLPPSLEEIDRFRADSSPDAYERLVHRLLANPHFGERWGRHWLDQARYADSHGYTNDGARSMWPYRDWVIRAFNDDMPFDRFTVEQLAGDLLPTATVEELVATGFHRNTLISTEGGSKPEQFRAEQAKDRVDTTGVVWLGLTVGCAKCHSHKYDPIEQKEYYELYAFFNSTEDRNSVAPVVELPTPGQRRRLGELEDGIVRLRASLAQEGADAEDEKRTDEREPPELKRLENELKALKKSVATSMVLRELDEPRETFLHTRGDFLRPGERVAPDVPDVLPALGNTGERRTRMDLARWLVHPDNPLTARVRVNRIWMRLFGRGIVETENDFGTQGSLPTHPGLLDWLARELMRQEWSTKGLIETIVTSSTYRQSSVAREDLQEADPRNLFLARQTRIRVEAEIVRDLALGASGLLSEKLGGPSVYPPQPDGVYAFTQSKKRWETSPGADRYRRGMYTFFYRTAPHPMLTTFDVPRFNEACTRRERSNTPLQSLTLANSAGLFEMAQALAVRVLKERTGEDTDEQDAACLRRMFRLCLARSPSAREAERLRAAIERQRARLRTRPEDVERLRPPGLPAGLSAAQVAAWTAAARALLNLDEFITRE